MRQILTTAGLTAGLVMGSAITASSATLIDFTDPGIFSTMTADEASGSAGGVYFKLTSSPFGNLTYNTGGDAPAPGPGTIGGGPLAGDGDGIGIRDDESGPNEYLVLEFFEDAAMSIAANVKITTAYFLDLYKADANDPDPESVFIYNGAPPSPANLVYGPIDGTQICCGPSGYKVEGGLSLISSIFSFDSGEGNDEAGVRDFALAAVEIAPIPLPAGALLLGTAIAGLGFARRKS